jgi:hypothetical protein
MLQAPPGQPNIPGNGPNQIDMPAEPGQMPEEQRLPSVPDGTPSQFQQQ